MNKAVPKLETPELELKSMRAGETKAYPSPLTINLWMTLWTLTAELFLMDMGTISNHNWWWILMDFFLIPQGQAFAVLMNKILSLDDGNNVSSNVHPWIQNEMFHYFFCEHCLNINWQCIFNSCPNQITRNVICSTGARVLFTCYKQNEIKYSPCETVCAVIWNEDFLCTGLITLKRDGNLSCFIYGSGVKDGSNNAVTEKIGTIVLTKSSIECGTILSSNSTLQHERSDVIWHH